jgi:tetratricopeptide (TPR) repeat protein
MIPTFRVRAVFALIIAAAVPDGRAQPERTPATSPQANPDQAILQLNQEIANHPENPELLISLGNSAVRANRLDLAISSFRQALDRIDPDSAGAGDLYLRLGETYRRQGASDSAIEALARARHILPENPVVLGTLALVLDSSGKKAEAEGAYRAALQADSDNPTTMNNLAFLIAENGGDLDEAFQLARRALQLLPDSADLADTAGWIQLKRNAIEDALALFAGALAKDPQNEEYRKHFLMALEATEAPASALRDIAVQIRTAPSAATLKKLPDLLKAAVGPPPCLASAPR